MDTLESSAAWHRMTDWLTVVEPLELINEDWRLGWE